MARNAATANRAGSFIVLRTWQRDMTPFTAYGVDPLDQLPADHNAAADTRAQNRAEDNRTPGARTIDRLARGLVDG